MRRLFRFTAPASLCALLLLIPSIARAEPGKAVPSVEIRLTVLEVSDMSAGQTPGQLAPPDFLKLSGVFTEEQLALALKEFLATNRGESLSLPPLVVRSGRTAKLQMTQEIRYATKYEPGTPPKPLEFESRDCGVIIEVTPTVAVDQQSIDLAFHFQITQVTGYTALDGTVVNFPQASIKKALAALPEEFPLDETVQPILSRQELTSSTMIYSGSTIVLGGIQTEPGKKSRVILIGAKIVPAEIVP